MTGKNDARWRIMYDRASTSSWQTWQVDNRFAFKKVLKCKVSEASKSCDILSFVIESVFINVSLRCIGNELKKNQYLIYCKRCPCQLVHLRVSPFMSIDHSHMCVLLWIKHKLHLKQCPHFYYGANKLFPYKFTFQGRNENGCSLIMLNLYIIP